MASAPVKFYAYISSAWVELLDVQPASVQRGMSDNLPETRMASTGDLSLYLKNSSGIYTPGTTAGWKKGIPIKEVFTFEGEEYTKFRGFIEDITLEGKPAEKIVKITALDWFDYASKYPVVNPALLEDSTADAAITELLSNMPIQPQATDLAVGDIVFDTVFDTVRGNTKAYSEISKLVNSEVGRAYLRADKVYGETLVFESATSRSGTRKVKQVQLPAAQSSNLLKEDGGALLLETGDNLLINDSTAALYDDVMTSIDIEYGRNIINRFTTNAYPKRTDEVPVSIYETERDIFLASGETKTFRIFWRDPDGKRGINARPPTGTTTTKALCHFDTLNGNFFEDELGKIWYCGENDMFRNNVVKFGEGAVYFDGTQSYIYSPHSEDWEFDGDFAVEWQEYRFASTSGHLAFSRDGTLSMPAWRFGQSNGTSSLIYISSNGVSADIANGKSLGTLTLNVWNHFAVGRTGNTFYAFKNGTLTDTWTSSGTILATDAPLYIGKNVSTYINAMIDEVRITKGKNPYTANFTAPTEPFSVAGSFLSLWTGQNATGTEITTSLTATANYGTEGATFTVTNTNALNGYLSMNIYGYGIYSDSALEDTQEDTDSVNNYGYQNVTLQQAYQQELYSGKIEGARVIELEHEPRTVLNSITMCANSSDFAMMSFLNVDIGDLVHIKNTRHSLDTMAYVEGINYSINGGIIMFTWIVRRAWTLEKGLDLVAVEFAGGAATDAINYGYIPMVAGSQTDRRIFSAWIYLDALDASRNQVIQSTLSDNSGAYFYVKAHATNRILGFYSVHESASGRWESAANSFNLGTWAHVQVFFPTDGPTDTPAFLVNGSSVSATEISSPSGTRKSEHGNSLIIGNIKTASLNYTMCFNGKIKDARIYVGTGGELASTLTGLYADGVGGTNYYNNLVHQAFVVRSDDLAAFTDLTLTDEKLLEGMVGYVGTPNGSPIVRAI